MPKNVQTTTQLHSYHTLAKWCSEFSKQGFNYLWTENFQMFKLNVENPEELEIRLPTSIESLKNHESFRKKKSTSALLCLWLCAAAATSLQSCPTLCNPRDGSPSGSPIPGILKKRTPEWVAISFSNSWKWKVKVKSLSHVRLLATPWTVAHQAPSSMGFFQARVLEWGAFAFSSEKAEEPEIKLPTSVGS